MYTTNILLIKSLIFIRGACLAVLVAYTWFFIQGLLLAAIKVLYKKPGGVKLRSAMYKESVLSTVLSQ